MGVWVGMGIGCRLGRVDIQEWVWGIGCRVGRYACRVGMYT